LENNLYLRKLGVCNDKGEVVKAMQYKYKQIEKFLDIFQSLIPSLASSSILNIVDMGAGKGYLTFALYDYLTNVLGLKVKLTGIELRTELTDFCNELAKECNFEDLHFEPTPIASFHTERIDVLIALHACDTATDDALFQGIRAKSQLILTAPCCHKQIRRQMRCHTELQSFLKHGILEERQAELLTDGIRALLLETEGYHTKVFEFVSNEHTNKNVMISAERGRSTTDRLQLLAKVKTIKDNFGIQYHQLERLLTNES
jgi:hypothetical protein